MTFSKILKWVEYCHGLISVSLGSNKNSYTYKNYKNSYKVIYLRQNRTHVFKIKL